jgi:rod shape determining protein RodA
MSTEFRRQIVWASVGLILMMFIATLNYRRIYDLSFYFYLASLVLLLYTFITGRVFRGSRWLRIGSFGIQVSEFAKITTILFMAWYLDSTKRNQKAHVRFIVSCIIAFIPMLMVLIQPDLGTALVFIPILLGMAYIAGVHIRYVIFTGLFIVFSGILLVLPLWQTSIMNNAFPFLMSLLNTRFVAASSIILALIILIAVYGFIRYKKFYFYWICYACVLLIISLGTSFLAHKVLKDYQIMRLIVFIDPNVDPQGSGWHIIQSSTAIGSGGVFGKGYLKGTQSHYRFLPEQSTDFIFSILSEEWGFLGGILIFVLFLIILLRLTRIMRLTSDTFGSYIVVGLISMYAFHFLINVGMTMGIMPITGIPLMFVSYGGSALLTSMAGIGLTFSVYARRYLHQ